MKAIAVKKGDFVPGHQAMAFFAEPNLPAVRGKIVETSKTSHAVVFEVPPVMAAFGLPRRSRWTWRRSVGAYQQEGSRTRQGDGLALLRT